MVDNPLITPEVEAMVGRQTEPKVALDEVCRSEIRRHVTAAMDDSRLWYDDEYAAQTKFGTGCAPGVYALRAVGGYRRDMGTPDGVRKVAPDGDWRDSPEDREMKIPWPEGVVIYHGGDDTEYFQLPRIGDVISRVTKIVKIVEKTGRSGKFAVVYSDKIFTNQQGEVLAINHGSSIARRMDTALGAPKNAG